MGQQDLLKDIRNVVMMHEPASRIILYGSRARGDARHDSDVDILILLPDTYKGMDFVRKKFEIGDSLYDLSLDCDMEISPFVTTLERFNAHKTPFSINVVNEGIEL